MKKILNAFYAIFAILILSFTISSVTGFNPLIVAGVVFASTLIPAGIKGVAFVGLNKEIWLPEIMEGFYGDDTFLTEARDMSAFVENDIINLAEAGVNPKVLINNTTYPIAVAQRADAHISLELDTYDTENTLVRNVEQAELSYDKRASLMYGHRQSLKMSFMQKAIHAYAPSTDSEFTPIITATGANNGTGVKRLSFEDILTLENRFDDAEIDSEGRILVLSTQHKSDLKKEDLKLYKEIFKGGDGFGGFKFYSLAKKRMPVFNRTTGTKTVFGAAAAGTDTICSVAFHKDEVMRADGTVDMFEDLKNPKERGDILGFQKRGLAMPIRGKGIGAVYSPSV